MRKNGKTDSRRSQSRTGAALLTAFALTACSPAINIRGHMVDPDIVNAIRIGQANKQVVESMLGTPSTVGMFGNEVWFYVGERTRTVSFFEPTVLERRVVAIYFDKGARVANIARYGLKDGKSVTPVARITPTKGKELGFIEQLVGNIGRFNTANEEDRN